MKTRGQAALEFMMTYGWAILVVLAAIGALSYFGILNPGRLTPDTCTTSSGFGCAGKPQINSGGGVAGAADLVFTVVNGFGYSVTLSPTLVAPGVVGSNVSLSLTDPPISCNAVRFCRKGTYPAGCTGVATPITVQDGQSITVRIMGCTLAANQVIRGTLDVVYANAQTGLNDEVTFTVGGKAR